ncbi:carboxylating nicotinate-nucleotide diphosphorylase [bacterium]|nr:carboxylating nicotinate-nucleotide diphosphorylase [bacterium]
MNPILIDPIVKNALLEDYSWGDVTSENIIPAEAESELEILLKEEGVIAGLPVAERTFKLVDPSIEWISIQADGDYCDKNTVIAKIKGNSRHILIAERVALNFLQRLSGIATLTRRFVGEVHKVNNHTRVLDTRKTTPGLRVFEKYAVKMGGGCNHRFNLSDSVLIKDNHLAILKSQKKSIGEVLKDIRSKIPHTTKIEIEADSLEQVKEILEIGVDAILLDNMKVEELRNAVELIDNRAITEASGGISLENIGQVAACGVDFISVGALTHSAKALDISLDYKEHY